MADLYAQLGVSRTADEAEIKRAYRKLAKELHPDRNKDNPKAAERFKSVTSAYDILSDKAKRGQYDRGEIDSDGNPAMPRGFDGFRNGPRPGAGPFGGGRARAGNEGFEADFGSILDELFGGAAGARGRGAGPRAAPRGADVAYRLPVPFVDAALARPQRITLRSGKTIDLKLPQGLEDGQQLRLPGQGEAGPGGAGDALVTIQIQPDARFTREGDDVRADLPVPLATAVLGGEVRAPTPDGEVMIKVSAGTTSGKVMRLKGRGWSRKGGGRGDLLARIMVDVPASDQALAEFLRARRDAAASG
jgi:DnaJ-class molecular chaperone